MEGVVDGAGHRVVDVLADQVHELQGAHRKPAALAHDGIDVSGCGNLLEQQAERLGVEGSGHTVDDEPGRGRGVDSVLAPGTHQVPDLTGNVRGRGKSADDLHQLHGGCRIEEMQPEQARWILECRTQFRDREGRRIAGEHGLRRTQGFQAGEQILLQREVLGNGLDHQARFTYGIQRTGRLHPGGDGAPLFDTQPATCDAPIQAGSDSVDRAIHCSAVNVVQRYGVPGGRDHLGDTSAHGTGADDCDRLFVVDGLDHLVAWMGRDRQSPVNSGRRFSRNAETPSR